MCTSGQSHERRVTCAPAANRVGPTRVLNIDATRTLYKHNKTTNWIIYEYRGGLHANTG